MRSEPRQKIPLVARRSGDQGQRQVYAYQRHDGRAGRTLFAQRQSGQRDKDREPV